MADPSSSSSGEAAPSFADTNGLPAITTNNLAPVAGPRSAVSPLLRRMDTFSSLAGSEIGNNGAETCRICRSEGTVEEPLFYPCKCNGSIRYVHQECLMEWLSHSHKKHCELCKTPFRFTKLYDADMPSVLPWSVFVRRAALHSMWSLLHAIRVVLVAVVWLFALPWLIRWSWRWMFWMADVGWAREAFVRKTVQEQLNKAPSWSNNMLNGTWLSVEQAQEAMAQMFRADQAKSGWKDIVSASMPLSNGSQSQTLNYTAPILPSAAAWPDADTSILSGFTYLSELTPNPVLNRLILDIFEGQLITCVVITGFILVFLIREWVVQQQPLVNLDNVNQDVQARLRQNRRRNEQLRRQLDLLEQEQARAADAIAAAEHAEIEVDIDEPGDFLTDLPVVIEHADADRNSSEPDAVNLENIEELVSRASTRLAEDHDHDAFSSEAMRLIRGIHAAEGAEADGRPLAGGQRAIDAILKLPIEQRLAWIEALRRENSGENSPLRSGTSTPRQPREIESDGEDDAARESRDELSPFSSSSTRRPTIGTRGLSSRATHIRRALEEAETTSPTSSDDAPNDTRFLRPLAIDASSQNVQAIDYLDVQSPAESSSILDPASPEDSWHEENRVDDLHGVAHSESTGRSSAPGSSQVELMPVTNAGPDSKTNIRRARGSTWKVLPQPLDEPSAISITGLELRRRLEHDSLPSSDSSPIMATDAETSDVRLAEEYSREEATATNNDSARPQDPEPDHVDQDSFRDRVASVFREEFGLDEADHRARLDGGLGDDNIPVLGLPGNANIRLNPVQEQVNEDSEDVSSSIPAAQNQPPAPEDLWTRAAIWFWGDLYLVDRLPDRLPPVPPVNEEQLQAADGDEVADTGPADANAAAVEPERLAQPAQPGPEQAERDPEVLAAAQQAGLDPDVVDEAEDLEGIFELIGLQGPIIGLFQTSCFCSVLVTGTIIGAVGLPYLWGKVVLSFVGNPAGFLFRVPLQVASIVADVVIDVSLLIGGWLAVLVTFLSEGILASIIKPSVFRRVSEFGLSTAEHALVRLESLLYSGGSQAPNWNWAFLRWSVYAHSSLATIQAEVNSVLNYIGAVITAVIDTISSGSAAIVWERSLNALAHVLEMPARLLAGVEALEQYTRPLLDALQSLKSGALVFRTTDLDLDPKLVYWNTTDRGLAVTTGYVALAALAAIYVALDTPITRTPAGQKTEKVVRDTLRQAGGVLKVILIISIEMLVFPLYCGLLLDLAFLPLFQGASMATRWAFAGRAPYTFCFVHWFIGTCYMFHFALFVGMCRKILRKGVLWFIRDPDDPTFHPVRDVLERNVTTQLRKIIFSALVYGALVILCLGGVIWSIGHVFQGIFPIYWISTEPVLEFPMDLLLYNFITPLLFRLFKPSDAVHAMYAWWLRRCARALRLSHFLFEDRRKDEEGQHVHKSWVSFLLLQRGKLGEAIDEDQVLNPLDAATPEVYFQRNGRYVLTPCNDQYRPPKTGEAFLFANDTEAYIVDKDGNRNDHFAQVYIPPSFQLRVMMFMGCLWLFSAFMGLSATLVPLVFGRYLFATFVSSSTRVNDVYAYSVGAYLIFGALYAGYKYNSGMRYLRHHVTMQDARDWLSTVLENFQRALRCLFVYGFLGIVLPVVFALIIQLYLIMPIHTLMVQTAGSIAQSNSTNNNTTLIAAAAQNATETLAQFASSININSTVASPRTFSAEHSIHLLADYALGLLYVRIAIRTVVASPTSRAAEAFRRITAKGYFDPDVKLATRMLILPASICALLVLLAPSVSTSVVLFWLNLLRRTPLTRTVQAACYRYAYPIAAITAITFTGVRKVAGATARWRARIRDEVYLVGERLHNFGEKKPPIGSRSVVRKER